MRTRTMTVLVTLLLTMTAAAGRAHETTYKGTIEAADKGAVRVRTVNDEGKVADKATRFTITDATRVLRGDRVLSFGEAKVRVGERIVVVVPHGDEAGVEWTCPMHPHIALEKAGQCPVCQMTLKERERPARASQVRLAAT